MGEWWINESEEDTMSKINWPLIIGTMIVILLLFTIIYEDSLIRSDPYSLDKG